MDSPLGAANFFPVGCCKPRKVGKHCPKLTILKRGATLPARLKLWNEP